MARFVAESRRFGILAIALGLVLSCGSHAALADASTAIDVPPGTIPPELCPEEGQCIPASGEIAEYPTIYVGSKVDLMDLPRTAVRFPTLSEAIRHIKINGTTTIYVYTDQVATADAPGMINGKQWIVRYPVTIRRRPDADEDQLAAVPCGLVVQTQAKDVPVKLIGLKFGPEGNGDCIQVQGGLLRILDTRFEYQSGDPTFVDVVRGSLETDADVTPSVSPPAPGQRSVPKVAMFGSDSMQVRGGFGTGVVVGPAAKHVSLKYVWFRNLKVGIELHGSADITDSAVFSGNATGALLSDADAATGDVAAGEIGGASVIFSGTRLYYNLPYKNQGNGVAIRVMRSFLGTVTLNNLSVCGGPEFGTSCNRREAVPGTTGLLIESPTAGVFGGSYGGLETAIQLATTAEFEKTRLIGNTVGVRFVDPQSFFAPLPWSGLNDMEIYGERRRDQRPCVGEDDLPRTSPGLRRSYNMRRLVSSQCRFKDKFPPDQLRERGD